MKSVLDQLVRILKGKHKLGAIIMRECITLTDMILDELLIRTDPDVLEVHSDEQLQEIIEVVKRLQKEVITLNDKLPKTQEVVQ